MYPSLFRLNYLTARSRADRMNANPTPNPGGPWRRWSRAVARNWKRRKMIAALHAMDDKLLRDMGIYRNDIERVVDGFDERELGMVPLAAAPTVRPEDRDAQRLTV